MLIFVKPALIVKLSFFCFGLSTFQIFVCTNLMWLNACQFMISKLHIILSVTANINMNLYPGYPCLDSVASIENKLKFLFVPKS